MVNFNNDTTITRPAYEINKVTVLERRMNCIDAFEAFYKQKKSGAVSQQSKAMLFSRVFAIYLELFPILERHSHVNFKELRAKIEAGDSQSLEEAFYTMLRFLDAIKLTPIDTEKTYNSTDAEAENEARL